MLERPLPLCWRQAALQLEARLREVTGQAPERLDEGTIRSCYPTRRWVAAWRISVTFPDGVMRRIDVVVTAGFPTVPVRTALVDHPEFMTWPHVESDGVLCLLPNLAECDPDDPSDVAANLLNRSVRLIEELLDGSIIERDFREEFLTYWAYKAHSDGAHLFSLLTPAPPSRAVRVWRGEGLEVVGEDAESLLDWIRNRFGDCAKTKIEDAAFIWLGEPLLPSAYPETASDLRALAAATGTDAVQVLDQAAVGEPDHLVTVIGAEGRGGAGLIGVKILNPKRLKSHPRSALEPLSKGFRPGRTPKSVLVDRFFGANPVIRSSVQRADATWIHGRGRDPRAARLLAATAVLIGCGSVGAPVACALAQAGVGRIILLDHDTLSWPNVGRHPLGATAVGRNKAEALAERLQTDYPHLQIEGRPCGLHELLLTDPNLLEATDLIIAATGSWAAENALNRWHVDHGRQKPVLYAWTEAHACAGHGVVIAGEGGCLQCHIGRTGKPAFQVVEWADGGGANQEEPACGAHYQPYGPVELSYVTAMVGELALDCLLDPPSQSFSRVVVASPDRIAKLGGRMSEAWLSAHEQIDSGLRTVGRPWPAAACVACGSAQSEKVA
ncbi:E2 family protein B [Paracoccus solventivorans]|uniref:E2 family protein B n=1 Tax=Paracoccus solventivorans TaxID=53463 RepID=A0A1M7K5L5_9RHOB|nr:ThiF family adenylyltransferase [Paracoccus solventivorans]SHM60579.1 E2 family protein B [Paracoccus solventivorans]